MTKKLKLGVFQKRERERQFLHWGTVVFVEHGDFESQTFDLHS